LPEFKGEALMPNGEFGPVDFKDYRGKWLILFFYPLDFTFVCPTEIRGFNKLYEEFTGANAIVMGASIDSVHSHKAWVKNGLGKLAFPLIGDTTHALTRSLGIEAADGTANRATFIVNPDGVIEAITIVSSNIGRSPDETLRELKALQTGGLAPCNWQPGEALLKEE
jgi:alkyl hydroperoxide reductase subunit AhpC